MTNEKLNELNNEWKWKSDEWRRGSQDFDLYELNEGMNVVDESQSGFKWKIKWIEQWMKMNVWWIKKRESSIW